MLISKVVIVYRSIASYLRPLTANLRWRPFSSVPHVSDRLELHNNNRASWILHPGPSESDVYSDVVQEARWNDLLHTARLLMRLDTPLHGNNARGAIYAVYYASVTTHTVFENIKMAALRAMSEEKCCSPFPCFSTASFCDMSVFLTAQESRDLRHAHQSYRVRNMHCAFPASFLGKIPNTPKLFPMPGKKFTWAVLKLWDLCLYICGMTNLKIIAATSRPTSLNVNKPLQRWLLGAESSLCGRCFGFQCVQNADLNIPCRA